MQITYDPAATSGHRYSVRLESGRRLEGIGRSSVESLLRTQLHLTVRETQDRIERARLDALATA